MTYAVRGDRWSTSWSSIEPTVYWIFAIIEVARIPARQFYAAGSNKTFWICVVVLLQIIGALLWLFVRRADVLEAEDWADEVEDPPPDWYMDEEAGALRWSCAPLWCSNAPDEWAHAQRRNQSRPATDCASACT